MHIALRSRVLSHAKKNGVEELYNRGLHNSCLCAHNLDNYKMYNFFGQIWFISDSVFKISKIIILIFFKGGLIDPLLSV